MDLRDAYRVLEVPVGANEEAVRDARKTLAKVWHPDRHANDPDLLTRAQQKLADVNTAFEAIRAAKYPSSIPEPKTQAARPPSPPTGPPPPVESETVFVPTRRVRWSVVLLILVAIGAGAYFAIVKLGTRTAPLIAEQLRRDAAPAIPDPDATAIEPAADATAIVTDREPIDAAPSGAMFTIGSTPDQVAAAQGQPSDKLDQLGVWRYGFSTVTFKRGKVAGWWDIDGVLNVKLEPRDAAVAARAKAAGAFGLGATKDEVLGLQGTPNHIETVIDEQWWYGQFSDITFDRSGKVRAWNSTNGELHVKN